MDGSKIRELTGSYPYDGFGFSLAGNADADADGSLDVLVSALNHTVSAEHSRHNVPGYVAMFNGDSGERLLTLQSDDDSGQFGHFVMFIGDVNADGGADFLVCDPALPNQTGRRPGRVHVFSGKTGTLLYTINGNLSHGFGFAAAPLDDIDADGVGDFAVSAIYGDPVQDGRAGYVTLYSGKTGSPIRSIIGVANDEMFGYVLSSGGDYDGDGKTDLLIGSNDMHSAPLEAFRIYSSVSGEKLLTVGTEGKNIGTLARIVGDANGDGLAEIAITGANAVYLYSGADTATVLDEYAPSSPGTLFGEVLCCLPDVNDDGIADLAICAPWEPKTTGSVVRSAGAAHIFSVLDHRLMYSVSGE
jgi:hypothetical protein